MGEAVRVANAAGSRAGPRWSSDLEGAARVGEHKTSVLRDVEAGRPLEVEALVGAVVEIGRLVGLELAARFRSLVGRSPDGQGPA
jgi:2-dehydropantoate 2-reductase